MSDIQWIPSEPHDPREWSRDVCKNLRELNLYAETWGFTIFRTVYTPQSDAQFQSFLSKLNSYVKDYVFRDLNSPGPPYDSAPNEELMRRFVNEVVEDPKLDGADEDQVRDAFAQWLGDHDVDLEEHALITRHRVCIMVDEGVLNSVAAAPEDPTQPYELEDVWVKVVEYIGAEEEQWQGWFKAGLGAIYCLWFNHLAGENAEYMYDGTLAFGRHVYLG
ncbi:50S ribosomal L17 protein [Rutstroemia sp. NJR-2017a BVV2]|nr:50S ribosomal L17 protein [Rutstroemia sp. NJR-2017a BVV2]